ncbi:MAG: MotA/TolQ/ExbB proton channel family protein [Myxococcota bacterium]
MVGSTLFDPLGLAVLVVVLTMVGLSLAWFRRAQQQHDVLGGGLQVLRRVSRELADDHPIRRRLESAPVVDLAFEEIARLMAGDRVAPAAQALVRLRSKIGWIERFAQFAVHLGILGTVFALVSSDPTDLEGFRARLPSALGTTFWGLVGALVLSSIAGLCESLLDRAQQHVRGALLEGLDPAADERAADGGQR